jgi:hypothetical protein
MLEINSYIHMYIFVPLGFGMNTLGFGTHHSFTTSPPKLHWIISIVYDDFEDFRCTILNACCLLISICYVIDPHCICWWL